MKPHEPKKRYKTRVKKKGKTKGYKKTKMLSQKSEEGAGKKT
jgi:hypothetical protein